MKNCKRILSFLLIFYSLNLFSQKTADVFPLQDVKEGAVAKGFTVIKGEDIFEFEAEIIGVQKIGSSDTDYIICKLKGKPFEDCGVVAAMSGSPLFLDGKFLGAIAIGWFFAKEPLCAATPAEKMVELYDKSSSGNIALSPKKPATFENFLSKINCSEENPKSFLAPLEEQNITLSQGEGQTFLKEAEISPGGMIGVQLISGDLNLTAYGTVSSTKGNKFLAFGHPFLGMGEVDFPVVKAKVSTIMPSFAFSFKMSSSQEEIGRMILDTPYGIVCEKGVKSNTIPIEILFTNSKDEKFEKKVNIVRFPELSKMLFFLSVSQILENLEENRTSSHIALESSQFDFENGTKFEIKKQIYGGDEPSLQLSSFLSEIFELLSSNQFEKPKIKSVKLVIHSINGKSDGNLIQIKSLKDKVPKGDKIEIEGIFQPFQKGFSRFSFSLPSKELPSQKIKIVVGDNISLYKRLVKSLEIVPSSFETLLSVLRKIPEGGFLYAGAFTDEESYLLGSNRIYNLPLTLKNVVPSAVNSNSKSSEKLLGELIPVMESGYFSSELELTVEIKEREEQ
ncbi:MAG: SpoIVB peptidase S55 domain-containing protein [Acidobacteriota bacterium]